MVPFQKKEAEDKVREVLREVLAQKRVLNEFRDDTEKAIFEALRVAGITFSQDSLVTGGAGITLVYKSEKGKQVLSRISMRGEFGGFRHTPEDCFKTSFKDMEVAAEKDSSETPLDIQPS